jgi:6-phosphogluconolactonase
MRFEITRRALLQSGAAAMLARAQSSGAKAVYAYVGSYTTAERYARGDGIHVYRVDSSTGAWTHIQHVGNLVNPSHLALSPDQRCLCSVHGDESYSSSFAVDRETGRLTLLGRAQTGGRNGVHPAFSPNGRFVIVANYSSGNVGVLPVGREGKLGDATQVVPLPGQPGPHRIEQASSHPHQVVFDPSGHYAIVPDKGLDRIFVFRFDSEAGKLTPTAQGSMAARAGSGPRHAAFHPTLPVVWVVNEIASTIATCYWEAEHGSLRAVQILPSIPPEFTGESTAAEIAVAPHGRFVYCSNRGHDSVAVFSADAGTGLLTSLGWEASRGRVPRFIGFDPTGQFIYAANEQSDTVLCWKAADGRLTPTGDPIRNASPVAIAFAAIHS